MGPLFKTNKNQVILQLMLVMILTGVTINPVPLHAEDAKCSEANESNEKLIYISDCGASINIDSIGTAYISGYIDGKSGVNDAYIKITLQKLSSTWNDVTYWEDYGGRNASIYENYNVSQGTYRLKVYCSAGSEAKMFNTNSCSY